MMFGHIETLEERVEHFERVRQLQDETGGFTAFISWTFQPEHTDMADVPPAGAFEYLEDAGDLPALPRQRARTSSRRGSRRGPRSARSPSTSGPTTWAA